jgi:hypothetical protein
LWRIGLGVAVDWNPPRRPQDNGVIERSQGTGKRWAEPSACASVAALQRHLEEMDDIQRRDYPSVRGRSRLGGVPATGSLGPGILDGLGAEALELGRDDSAPGWLRGAASGGSLRPDLAVQPESLR